MTTRAISTALFACGLLATAPVAAGQQQVLYKFCKTSCNDGALPLANVVRDPSGNLFGMTSLAGGQGAWGTVFELEQKAGGGWKFRRLHVFCRKSSCKDGMEPQSNLIVDTNGNLYGTTSGGGRGRNAGGTVFELTPAGNEWTFTTLHSFTTATESAPVNLTYAGAASGAPYDGVSTLYGVASNSPNGAGAIFSLTPKSGLWHHKLVYTFCSQTSCADGGAPSAGLLVDGTGNLFATTISGGTTNNGTLVELSSSGGTWNATILHSFCLQASCTDGGHAGGGVVPDGQGNLIGVAATGGADNGGVLYRIVPDGVNSQYSIIHDFCALANCTDGADPFPSLAMDGAGNFFGTTILGGVNDINAGTLFELSAAGQFSVLYSFCGASDCSDGKSPAYASPLALDGAGNIFGATQNGGFEDDGVIYEYSP